jgi:hypothetical protein
MWRRDHARLRPGRSPWAVLVYTADDGTTVQVRLFDSAGHVSAAPDAGWRTAGVLGRMEILRCEADPALPGLPMVLDALEGPRVVRYR